MLIPIVEALRIQEATSWVSNGTRHVSGKAVSVTASGQYLKIALDTGDVVSWRSQATVVSAIADAYQSLS